MAYRNLLVESPAQLSVQNAQLIVKTDIERSVPLEDISCLLLESLRGSISTAALCALSENNVCVLICDEKHLPSAVLMPFSQHSRHLAVLKNQLALSTPYKKRLWQQIVVSKIQNQATCLALCGKAAECAALHAMARTVTSGDAGHVEAAAAAAYFRALFGAGFARRQEDVRNASLNYGYAILRGVVARHLAAYGFLPAFGLFHCSELNAFNLADDFIEPYRPVVDLFVACNVSADTEAFTPQLKRALFNLLNLDIRIGKASYSVNYAIEKTVQSFGACTNSAGGALLLPQLLEAKQHCYE